jgi:PAS domain S-box-containing protein
MKTTAASHDDHEKKNASKTQSRLRFSTVLMVTIIVLVVVSVLISLGLINRYFNHRVELEFQKKLRAQRGQVEILIKNRLGDVQKLLKDLTSDNTIRVTLLLGADAQLNERLDQYEQGVDGVYPFIRKVDSGSVFPGLYPGFSQAFLDTLLYFLPDGDIFYDGTRTRLLWLLTHPVVHDGGRMGSAYVLYDLMEDVSLQQAIAGAVEGELVVFHLDTLTSLTSGSAHSLDAAKLKTLSERNEYVDNSGNFAVSKVSGTDRLYFLSSLESLNEDKRRVTLLTGVFSIFALVVSMLISVYLGRKMVRPLREMTRKAIRISEGEKSLQFDSDETYWEFDQLSQAFNTMLVNLKEAEERSRYKELLENVDDAVYLVDADGKILDANTAAYDSLGYRQQDFFRLNLEDVLPRPESATIIRQLNTGSGIPSSEKLCLETVHRKRDGGNIPVEIYSRPIFYQGRRVILNVARDISRRIEMEEEKKQLEAQLIQAQKMEAIGTLAGGVAHDFNNLLMGIQGRLAMIRMQSGPEQNHAKHVNAIERTVMSAADLTRQLLGFARKGRYEIKTIATNTLVEDSTKMFIRTRKEINLKLALDENIWPIKVDRNQIEQVLINLYVNAWQAMPQGGDLSIETLNVHLDESFCRPFEVPSGDFVKITVADTGSGMDEQTLARIFEPFFTTKGVGKGTGLGLASAYGIVRNHKGIIQVQSEPGQGTTFDLYLPAHAAEVSAQTSAVPKRLPRWEGTVLLADDDEEALLAESLMLKEMGFEVVEVCT